MGRHRHSWVGLALAGLLVAPGCVGGPGGPVTPRASRKPASSAPAPVATGALAKAIAGAGTRQVGADGLEARRVRLAGKVELLSNNGGGIISDNGGGIISNNSGAIISDNGGGIISDNGGGVVANNGASYQLAQAQAPAEFGLADAIITVRDAAGNVLLDAQNRPVTATSDRQGRYVLEGELPNENLVLEIKLWQGGTLAAMLTKDAKPEGLDLDTASSIGARYVLGQYVQGRQATYDKLPGDEAARLHRALDQARAKVKTAPAYDAAELVALGERLRAEDGPVDASLTAIKAILLGQANLGAGRKATEVPLMAPKAMAVDAAGTLFLAEGDFGRIRAVGPDGTMRTHADSVRGQVVKQNFAAAHDMLAAPDGSLYVATPHDGRVWHLFPDGRVEIVAGAGTEGRATADRPARETPLYPQRLALGADGTLYIGEGAADPGRRPRVFALGADGVLRVAFEGQIAGAGISGLAVVPQGFAYLETREFTTPFQDRAVRRFADGREEALEATDVKRGLATAPDGTIYVSQIWAATVLAFRPDGTKAVVVGPGGAPGSDVVRRPTRLACGPDGALHVLDVDTNIVYRRAPDGGAFAAVAGTTGIVLTTGDLSALPLNGPSDVAIAPDGAMVVSENGSGLLKRFDGRTVTTLAGGLPYYQAALDLTKPGEGIPALGSCLYQPRGLAYAGAELLVVDTGNTRIRAVAPDGTVRTRIGVPGPAVAFQDTNPDAPSYRGPGIAATLPPGQSQAAAEHLALGNYVAVSKEGRAYWTTGKANQLFRERADGRVEAVSGLTAPGADTILGAFLELADGTPAAAWKPTYPSGLAFGPDGDLYVVDSGALQVRRIRGLDGPSPTVTTVAGVAPTKLLLRTSTDSGDGGPATDAPLVAPTAICFDAAGNLYVGEVGTGSLTQLTTAFGAEFPLPPGVPPSHARVRRITPAGVISTVAGPGSAFFADPTAEDALIMPTGLAIDAQGRLYIADAGSNLVRILPAGKY